MANLFSSPDHVQLYSRYRPTYPDVLYEQIFQFLDEGSDRKLRGVAADVGCGCGQSTRVLAEHFQQVLGVDGSEAQLEEARKVCSGSANISFQTGSAEQLDQIARDESVDLVTVATALHFFDVQPFFEASLKVLRHGGVLAAYCYDFRGFDNPDANQVAKEFFRGILQGSFDPRTRHVFNRYEDLFSSLGQAFPETKRWSCTSDMKRSLHEISGFIQSLSAFRTYQKHHPDDKDPIRPLIQKLKTIYGTDSEDERLMTLSLDFFMILGKKV